MLGAVNDTSQSMIDLPLSVELNGAVNLMEFRKLSLSCILRLCSPLKVSAVVKNNGLFLVHR